MDFALAGDSTITSVLDTISPQNKVKKVTIRHSGYSFFSLS
ncbi:hypothetical protein DSOL_3640 [Desulfosporosinus metallidurans]|uniref:Uncharacterized protein n=1 Tax=Desulfosporosinus metallidurans TaxID=1888891 RepID=A0A1Q8QPM2_9FIRM|nr:hypothetical protein DSOL_3640 [Desulfosporosinus metallidurans]